MYNTIYPGYVQSYYNINQRQIQPKQDEEKSSASSKNTDNEKQNTTEQNRQSSNSYFPNGEKVAIDYTKKQIGIEQILSDFRNTANAIGTPEDIKKEVSSYLSLVESQAQKTNPNREIIQSNLKNASKILDEFITNTLKKPSRVVEEWVDTLFLQPIDFKVEQPKEEIPIPQEETKIVEEQIEVLPQTDIEETEIKEDEVKQEEPKEEVIEQNQPSEKNIYVPKDERLKRMFIQAKKYALADNKETALRNFKNSMDYAEEIGDEQTQAMIHFEEGKLYNEFNRPEDALYNFAIAALQSEDNNLKARAYMSMGKIYDDYINFEPAVEHYGAAAAYAGEADNLKMQSKALSELAEIHARRYDKNNADMFMKLAAITANSTKDDKVIGVIYAKNAKMQNRLGEKARALTSYSTSTEAYSKLSEQENLAKNYREAAMIMKEYGNKAKAKTLLNKAYSAARNTDNSELRMLILQDMAFIR